MEDLPLAYGPSSVIVQNDCTSNLFYYIWVNALWYFTISFSNEDFDWLLLYWLRKLEFTISYSFLYWSTGSEFLARWLLISYDGLLSLVWAGSKLSSTEERTTSSLLFLGLWVFLLLFGLCESLVVISYKFLSIFVLFFWIWSIIN